MVPKYELEYLLWNKLFFIRKYIKSLKISLFGSILVSQIYSFFKLEHLSFDFTPRLETPPKTLHAVWVPAKRCPLLRSTIFGISQFMVYFSQNRVIFCRSAHGHTGSYRCCLCFSIADVCFSISRSLISLAIYIYVHIARWQQRKRITTAYHMRYSKRLS